jgi:hypothetical protein
LIYKDFFAMRKKEAQQQYGQFFAPVDSYSPHPARPRPICAGYGGQTGGSAHFMWIRLCARPSLPIQALDLKG